MKRENTKDEKSHKKQALGLSEEEKLPFNKKRSPTESDLENTGSTGWRCGEEHGKTMISKQDKNNNYRSESTEVGYYCYYDCFRVKVK